MRVAPLLLLTSCAAYNLPEAVEPAAQAAPLPITRVDTTLLTTLLQNQGTRPMLVNFWATWCPPCVAELPMLERVARASPGINLLLVNVDDPGATASVTRFLQERAIQAPSLHLADGDPTRALRQAVHDWPDVVPVTLLLDPGGAERARFVGVVSEAELRRVLAQAQPESVRDL